MEIGETPATAAEESLRLIHVRLVGSRRLKIDTTWGHDLESPFWRLYVQDRSGASIIHQGHRLPLNAGQVHLIPSWVRFQCSATRSVTQDFLHFYLTGLPPTLLRRFFHRPLRLPRNEAVAALCRRWREGFDAKPAFPPLGWAAALAQAAVTLAMEDLPPAEQAACFRALSGFNPINPALQCLDERLSRPPENAELARLCHFSTDHFIRQFHLIVGMTPAKYGLERRLASAAQGLTSSNRTLEDIADSTGFTDRFHFSRAFKARLGVPPAAYRRLHRVDAREG